MPADVTEREIELMKLLGRAYRLMPDDTAERIGWLADVHHQTENAHGYTAPLFTRREEDALDLFENQRRPPPSDHEREREEFSEWLEAAAESDR